MAVSPEAPRLFAAPASMPAEKQVVALSCRRPVGPVYASTWSGALPVHLCVVIDDDAVLHVRLGRRHAELDQGDLCVLDPGRPACCLRTQRVMALIIRKLGRCAGGGLRLVHRAVPCFTCLIHVSKGQGLTWVVHEALHLGG